MSYRMRDLENFAVAAQSPTMSEASRRLSISQPSLSESIARLERDAGAILFYRSRSGIQLTPKGRDFRSKVDLLLETFRNLATAGSGVAGGYHSIVVGCHTTVASYSIPGFLSRLRETAPECRVELKHDLSRAIQLEVQMGRIDLGIVVNPVRVPDLVISKVGTDTVSVWHGGAGAPANTVICNPALIQTQSILKKWRKRPSQFIETESLDLICRLTASGLGYGIIPARAVALSGLDLREQKTLPHYRDEIALVYRPEFGKSGADRLILDAFRSSFR